MCPLSAMSERAPEIEENVPSPGDVPGLAEQFAEQVGGIKKGLASAELLTLPGFYSFPSMVPSLNA